MPYRRLPNTDSARIRALKAALEKGSKIHPFKLAYNQNVYVKIKTFLPRFERSVTSQRQALSLQAKKNKAYLQLMNKAQMYLSHFIQVLNFSIAREEHPKSIRKYFGIKENDTRVTLLNTEDEIIVKGEQIINGEQRRTQEGNSPLLNPSISLVKIQYEKFIDAFHFQKQLKENSHRAQLKVASLRMAADELILDVWNQVEKRYENSNPDEKRKLSSEYGVIYIYRKNEKKQKGNIFQMSA